MSQTTVGRVAPIDSPVHALVVLSRVGLIPPANASIVDFHRNTVHVRVQCAGEKKKCEHTVVVLRKYILAIYECASARNTALHTQVPPARFT